MSLDKQDLGLLFFFLILLVCIIQFIAPPEGLSVGGFICCHS